MYLATKNLFCVCSVIEKSKMFEHEILGKSKVKNQFSLNIDLCHIGFDLGQKSTKLSHACVPLMSIYF
jgi:hypothetical protein